MNYQEFKELASYPVSSNFTQKVVNRFKEESVDSFWAIFDVLPHPVLKVGFALSIIVIIAFSLPAFTLKTTTQELSSADKLIYYGESTQQLETDSETLSFALNATSGE